MQRKFRNARLAVLITSVACMFIACGNPHDPFISGNNMSYMVIGYYPKEELAKILPRAMSIPSDELMTEKFPTVKKIKGMHPFMFIFASCSNVHDVMTEWELSPYKEHIPLFPVIYTHKNEEQLCSYMPVLYLDYLKGVIGGLYLGLRKEYHPNMIDRVTDTSRSVIIKNLLEASFQQSQSSSSKELDPFFTHMLKNPRVTISYFNLTSFYTSKMSPKRVVDTSHTYKWNYKGSEIKSNKYTLANYTECSFTTSRAMSYENYFHPSSSLE